MTFMRQVAVNTTVSLLHLTAHRSCDPTFKYASALTHLPQTVQGPFPGFNATVQVIPLPTSGPLILESPLPSPLQWNIKLTIPMNQAVHIAHEAGIHYDQVLDKVATIDHLPATHATGPSRTEISVTLREAKTLPTIATENLNLPVIARILASAPESPLGFKLNDADIEQHLQKNAPLLSRPIRIMHLVSQDVGAMAVSLSQFIVDRHESVQKEGRLIGNRPEDREHLFAPAQTFRNLTIQPSVNVAANYWMLFDLQQQPRLEHIDNAMHVHPSKRIEEHQTGPGTIAFIFSWNPICDETGISELPHSVSLPDPCVAGKQWHIYMLPENSSMTLCLPQMTPHKFKVALTPMVFEFCKEYQWLMLLQGHASDAREKEDPLSKFIWVLSQIMNNNIDNIGLLNPKIVELAESVAQRHSRSAEDLWKAFMRAGAYIIDSLHPEETDEIMLEGIDQHRNLDQGGSISAQTYFLEPAYYISQRTMNQLVHYFEAGHEALKAEHLNQFIAGVKKDHDTYAVH